MYLKKAFILFIYFFWHLTCVDAAFRSFSCWSQLLGTSYIWSSSLQRIWSLYIFLDLCLGRSFWQFHKLPPYSRADGWWHGKHSFLDLEIDKFISMFHKPVQTLMILREKKDIFKHVWQIQCLVTFVFVVFIFLFFNQKT